MHALKAHHVARLVDQHELVHLTRIANFAHHVRIRAVGDQSSANQEGYAAAGLPVTAPDPRTVALDLNRLTAAAAPVGG